MSKQETGKMQYTLFDTAWGQALIAWSGKGVCRFILPGLSKAKMMAELRRDCPGAKPGEDEQIAKVITQVQDYFAGEVIEFKASLDLSWASPFQAAVYRALRQVRYGETTSYGELAKAAGRPGAGRAVGQANAENRIPLLIPCHRVLRADGELGGFSGPGGRKMKALLLVHEKPRQFSCGP